jgi:hypothetical protein
MISIPMIFDRKNKTMYAMQSFYEAWALFESEIERYNIYISKEGEFAFE